MPKEQVKEEPFYVGVKDTDEVRRTLLETTRDVVQHLQRSEKFKAVRKEKLEQIDKLKKLIKEITKDVNKLKAVLPRTKLRATHKKVHVPKKPTFEEVKKEVRPQPEKKHKPATELEKLEAELSEIEGRLGHMS